jgi:hypothetical protein
LIPIAWTCAGCEFEAPLVEFREVLRYAWRMIDCKMVREPPNTLKHL